MNVAVLAGESAPRNLGQVRSVWRMTGPTEDIEPDPVVIPIPEVVTGSMDEWLA